MDKDKKVSFDVFPEPHAGDEELLVVVNQGASDSSRVRRRSRAVSKVSMGSEAEEEIEDQSIARTESSVSTKEYCYSHNVHTRAVNNRLYILSGWCNIWAL